MLGGFKWVQGLGFKLEVVELRGLRLGPGAECSCSGLPFRIVWMVQSSRWLGIFMMVWGVGCSRLYAASWLFRIRWGLEPFDGTEYV